MNKKNVSLKEIVCPRCGQKEFIKKGTREHKSGAVVPIFKCKVCNYKFTQGKAKEAQLGKKHQTGKTSVQLDKMREAKLPGKRTTEWGTTYFEFRRNRSDVDPKKML
jgi:transposase-like protein